MIGASLKSPLSDSLDLMKNHLILIRLEPLDNISWCSSVKRKFGAHTSDHDCSRRFQMKVPTI